MNLKRSRVTTATKIWIAYQNNSMHAMRLIARPYRNMKQEQM